MYLLEVIGAKKSFGGVTALNNVAFHIRAGEIVGLYPYRPTEGYFLAGLIVDGLTAVQPDGIPVIVIHFGGDVGEQDLAIGIR